MREKVLSCSVLRVFFAYVVAFVATHTVGAESRELTWPSPEWPAAEPADRGMDATGIDEAERYALSAGGSGMIVRHGEVIRRWGDQAKLYDIKSATKSFGATMLGVAIEEGKIELDAPARRYHPTLGTPPDGNLQDRWLDDLTILQLATQTAGFEKPGGYTKLLFKPGTHWHYSDGGPNWLAECLTLKYRRDLEDVMRDRIFTPLGITPDDLRWRANQYRDHEIQGIPRREFGAGIYANVEALSRLGYLYLRKGQWGNKQIITREFVRMASQPVPSVVGLPEWSHDNGNASEHYGLLWWNNGDGELTSVPRDAFWASGLYDSLIVVIPSLDLVAVRCGAAGKSWPRKKGDSPYRVLEPFLNPLVAGTIAEQWLEAAAQPSGLHRNAPYPASSVVTSVEWEPPSSIVRLAEGCDNWPLTWADDGSLYTAYGDGWGFMPRVEKKLSLGLAKIVGGPADPRGINIRSESGERVGQGAVGEKASGMLMIDGMLYMALRNASNSQLAWSEDHGVTWQAADWKFETSFGAPTFLNFGQDYAGARDEYVYVYSHDADSAYQSADQMVLARVQKTKIRDREAYDFFVGLAENGSCRWSNDINDRGAVFQHPDNCYRSGVSYNAALRRYLWVQTLPGEARKAGPDARFQGGFAIYDAPEPWGPWSTVYYTEDWDVGPGETGSLPTKWMSDDGKTVHLVFSGDDYFSVRKATLVAD